ncbi:MAG: hypothetical protein WBF90_23655 [Rivularia sp. (in: cyanobacteria)]|jgi:hypothetical protein
MLDFGDTKWVLYWGTYIGRPAGSEKDEEFLSKPSSQRVAAAFF